MHAVATSVTLPFERPIVGLLARIAEVRELAETDDRFLPELQKLEEETARVVGELYSALTPYERVQLSRHGDRPLTLDYIGRMCTDWVELKGDRRFAEDSAIVGGLAKFHGRSVVIVGHQKGRSTKENLKRNFGMPHPEGYRKAIRMYELAHRFGLPVLTFIDTQGAYPGIGAEERGQSEAIGQALATMSQLPVPMISTITGEGGSGGALALGVGNRVLVLQFGCYSVITPEGCAAILWRDGAHAPQAADQLQVTAPNLLRLGAVDEIVEEPPGGAHRDHDATARSLDAAILRHLEELEKLSPEELIEQRYQRFRTMGAFEEGS